MAKKLLSEVATLLAKAGLLEHQSERFNDSLFTSQSRLISLETPQLLTKFRSHFSFSSGAGSRSCSKRDRLELFLASRGHIGLNYSSLIFSTHFGSSLHLLCFGITKCIMMVICELVLFAGHMYA
jgi:hypothetical protein